MNSPSSFEVDGIIQVNVENKPTYSHRIRDAKNYSEWDDYDIHTVILDPAEITIEGTPEAIRWLYDLMEEMKKEWRLEGEPANANMCQDIAEVLWDALGEDPPDRQRTRRLR